MKPVRFDLKCEGDIEKFSAWSRDRVQQQKTTEVVLGVPNLHWPRMVIDMLIQEADGDADADQVYMNIDFEIKYVDDDLVLTEDDLEDMFKDMSDEEFQDFIEDVLEQHESEKEEEEEGDDDNA